MRFICLFPQLCSLRLLHFVNESCSVVLETVWLAKTKPKYSPNPWWGSGHPTQNMGPWHIEYIKPKIFEKCHVQEELPDLSLKWVIKPSCERCPLSTWEKGASSLRKQKGHRKESEQTGLVKSSPVYST